MPRRILMTADPIGGVWTYALELARALERHGIEIALATMGAHLTRDQYQQVLARKNMRLFESAYRLEWMDNAWDDVGGAGDWLLRMADRVRPDLVHLNGYSHATLPWNSPVLVVAHSCVLSWWRAVKNQDAPPKYDEYRARVAAGLAAADSIVAPSNAMRAAVQLHYNAPATCAVIHNARDPRLFTPEQKDPVVFACGRIWDEAKNLRLLDEIGQMSRWPVTVAGDCRHPDGSTVALQNVRCLGNVSPGDVAQELSRAAIFILPAFYEPFGLSALEAGLSGCALVLGDIASLREIWGDAAIFVAPHDSFGFARALNSLIADPHLLEYMGRRARARALEFSPHRMADEYVRAYHDCFDREFHSAAGEPPLLVEEVAA